MLVHIDRDAFWIAHQTFLFAEKLLEEESVLVLPGTCFELQVSCIVTTVPEPVLQAAWDRVESFVREDAQGHFRLQTHLLLQRAKVIARSRSCLK